MKKLLVTSLLAVSCSAFAGIPAGYEEAPAPNDKTSMIVNKEKQAFITVSVLDEAAPANEAAAGIAQQYGCGEAQGDETKAAIENCEVNGQKMNVLIVNNGSQVMVLMANQNASQEDVATVLSE